MVASFETDTKDINSNNFYISRPILIKFASKCLTCKALEFQMQQLFDIHFSLIIIITTSGQTTVKYISQGFTVLQHTFSHFGPMDYPEKNHLIIHKQKIWLGFTGISQGLEPTALMDKVIKSLCTEPLHHWDGLQSVGNISKGNRGRKRQWQRKTVE